MDNMTTPALPIVTAVANLRETVGAWRKQGLTVGFVPTMGALHEGHLTLVREAGQQADRVVASIFVNPTQFAAHEDLGSYPRQEARDAELLASAGCHLMFAPPTGEMYPDGFVTGVTVGGPSEGLETDFRPHFFGGVAVVVAKLLNQVRADVAVFGEKDYQQLMVVRRMTRDLDIPTRIVGAPTQRDGHGLALSSRNGYLSEEQRALAPALYRHLSEMAHAIEAGERDYPALISQHLAQIEAIGFRPDYLEVRHAQTLLPAQSTDRDLVILVAAFMGATRLIDNVHLNLDSAL